jgi:hypothetical protein
MDSPQPVAAPDPTATAAAQAASNKETAIAQANLNNYDKVGPDGSQTYTVIGTNADGTPKYQQNTSLSAPNQAIYDTNQGTKQNLATIGQDQSKRIGDLLGTPFSVDQSIANKITTLGKTNLDPQWAANDSKQAASLANQGITPGSEAYDNAMRSYNASKNAAYNNLYLAGDAQAEQESLAERNQPINEISALLSGSQVGTPSFAATPQTSVAGTDIAGITQNSYLDANQQAQQAVAGNNATMGGLFGLAGQGLQMAGQMYKPSDRRLKRDISRVGTLDNGLPVYLYRYIAGGPFEIGLMSDDVAPEAVRVGPDGFDTVDYARATGRAS